MSRVRTPSIAPFLGISLTLFDALILGIVQGITEFFPISSSAHLQFTRWLMGLSGGEQWLYFDLACHLGTWASLVFYLKRDILQVLKSVRQMSFFALALFPLVPAYFLLKPVRIFFSNPSYTGFFLLFTSFILWIASRKQKVSEEKYKTALAIGCAQALALIPGISRSGSTIAIGRLCGWEWKVSARFSFLLAVPTILGGELLESYKLLKEPSTLSFAGEIYLIGFLSSLLVGLGAVRFVFWCYERKIVKPFALYCFLFGLLLLWAYGT